MPLYFMMLGADWFHDKMRPALSASWQQQSLEPCRAICAELLPTVSAFAEKYRMGADESLLSKTAEGLAFDRDFWQLLVGEMLLYGATEIPEIQCAPDTLRSLLAPESVGEEASPAQCSALIEQAHFGTHDLCFGTKYYRPDHAGLNDVDDVARLAQYLDSIDPDVWTVANLRQQANLANDEERKEELEWVKQCFADLSILYQRARACRDVIVCEVL